MADKEKHLFYQRDMMHCDNNIFCKLKDTCYRCWLYKNGKGHVSVYHPTKNLDRDSCEYYLDIKNYMV